MQAGDHVKITGGAYKGSSGVIEAIDGATATISISARVALTEIESETLISPAAAGQSVKRLDSAGEAGFSPGSKVKITGGGYKGCSAVVDSVEGDLVAVTLDWSGVPMVARIPATQVQADPPSTATATIADKNVRPSGQAPAAAARFTNGDKVRITGGGYKGSSGVIDAIDGDLAKVSVDSFGMPMVARIPLIQLERVDG